MTSQLVSVVSQDPMVFTEIVAAVLTHQDQLALLRRSELVTGDIGRWNCITGFLDPDHEPLSQAFTEIEEEAGIAKRHLRLLGSSVLNLVGSDGRVWRVHTFHFHSLTKNLTLNWENDACTWLHPRQLEGLSTVPWFTHILDACGLSRHSLPASAD
ncbi:MAG: NUDIX domain-containing protein [Pseudomonas sp.]|uniref:Putative NUDIX hydrolase n=1 Tax=Pseudomonas putida TaxID=303 RepID=M5AXL8_PSEPU|nr:NUDIX domain-containing protein [Pseudomonas monteilii]MBA4681437.1 NUDIX domain-containing protein [Pseudomonas sp.]MDD2126950.1 NUDIX domain-containing protein [Pseudomonas monteilii]BAN13300.1 putative NUDIX hydrolase [Pseudomonas putida]